jgi:DNA (cytosine-5)-methyltransferase 3A
MATEDKIEITTLEDYLDYKKKGFKFSGQSYLFWEYIRILKEVKPTYFFLENVKMETKWKDIITKALGVEPININSNLLSAQNRDRLYWTNINKGKIPVPNDKNLVLKDIIIPEMEDKYPLSITHYNAFMKSYPNWKHCPIDKKSKPLLATYYKQPPHCPYIPSSKSESGYRRLSPIECERLQTLPDEYTKGVSDTQRYKMIGNGWTIDVIAYIFSFIENYKFYEKVLDTYTNFVSCKEFIDYIDLELGKEKLFINVYNEKFNYKKLTEDCINFLKKGGYGDEDLINSLSL